MATIFYPEDDSAMNEGQNEPAADESVQKVETGEGKAHSHAHPQLHTIHHNSHGRSNSRPFGIDHEPGVGI